MRLISTTYYPDLSRKMAMKMGGEYEASRVQVRHFEHFANNAGLSKALARGRMIEIAELIVERLPELAVTDAGSQVARLIREQCEQAIKRFQRDTHE